MESGNKWLYSELGRQVRLHREQQKITQEKLGEMVGFARTSITNIEKGRQHIALHQLYAIARALQVRAEALLPRAQSDESSTDLSDKMPAGTDRAVAEWAEGLIRKGE
jgi:transcriptional regulator with XRE-family HTH domain